MVFATLVLTCSTAVVYIVVLVIQANVVLSSTVEVNEWICHDIVGHIDIALTGRQSAAGNLICTS